MSLIPPANEVFGKVMFSQVFVCPQGRLPTGVSAYRGCLYPGVQGVSAYRECRPTGTVSIQRGLPTGAVCIGRGVVLYQRGWADPPPPVKLEKRAVRTYWNAFL